MIKNKTYFREPKESEEVYTIDEPRRTINQLGFITLYKNTHLFFDYKTYTGEFLAKSLDIEKFEIPDVIVKFNVPRLRDYVYDEVGKIWIIKWENITFTPTITNFKHYFNPGYEFKLEKTDKEIEILANGINGKIVTYNPQKVLVRDKIYVRFIAKEYKKDFITITNPYVELQLYLPSVIEIKEPERILEATIWKSHISPTPESEIIFDKHSITIE
ncbi:MAG: hypothetical protein NC921_03995 [Candidatus Omnitrophica bacterium]|nr:hypothetical protein [Candidatus Omnitrophota bacterium]